MYRYFSALGQDHHRLTPAPCLPGEGLKLGGYLVEAPFRFLANSDGDVVLHALCNAISGLSTRPFLGPPADALCQAGVTDSRLYVAETLKDLKAVRPSCEILHVSFSLEGAEPKLFHHLPSIAASVASLLHLPAMAVALTVTTGEGLTGMGRGEGLGALCLVSVRERDESI